MLQITKPYYQLNINSFCTTEVYVNDVLVDEWKGKETEGRERNSSLTPINQVLLQTGKYKVVAKMYPRQGEKLLTEENSYLGIDFFLSDISDIKNSRITFHQKLESPWDGLSQNIKYSSFELTTEIDIELPFILDGWQNSVNLAEIKKEELFKEVINYYKQIQLVLKEHNAAKYLDMSQEKMKLHEQAFYFNDERKKSFLDSAAQLFSQKLELEELNENNLKMEIMGYGKLVRLVRLDGSQAMQFKSPDIDKQSNIELEIKLHKRTKQQGFSII